MDLATFDGEVNSLEDLVVADSGAQAFDAEKGGIHFHHQGSANPDSTAGGGGGR